LKIFIAASAMRDCIASPLIKISDFIFSSLFLLRLLHQFRLLGTGFCIDGPHV
jgi:hypothetical protein